MEEKRPIEDSPESLEQNNPIPKAMVVLFVALILWGLYYIYYYTPQITGWSYYKKLEREMAIAKERTEALAVKVPEKKGNPYKGDQKAIQEGKAIFQNYCAVCHGEDLKGGVGPDLTGSLRYGDSDMALFESVSKGRGGGMPPFGDQLGSDRVWKVISFVESMRD